MVWVGIWWTVRSPNITVLAVQSTQKYLWKEGKLRIDTSHITRKEGIEPSPTGTTPGRHVDLKHKGKWISTVLVNWGAFLLLCPSRWATWGDNFSRSQLGVRADAAGIWGWRPGTQDVGRMDPPQIIIRVQVSIRWRLGNLGLMIGFFCEHRKVSFGDLRLKIYF